MRVEVKTEGGLAHFPGRSRPLTIDTDQLTAEEARELEQLVRDAGLFDLPPVSGQPPKGAADYRQHTITIEDAGRTHTVRLTEPLQNPAIQSLIRFVNTKARGRK